MRLALLVLVGLVAWPAASRAEKVKANQSAKVYNRAGEQGKVIVKVEEGQSMTLLAKDGRWLKVRVSGRTGWVPRSKVDMPEGDDDIARNTRRRPFVDGRGTKRGFGGEAGPDDRVGADATEDRGGDDDKGKGKGGDDEDTDKGKGKAKGGDKGGDKGKAKGGDDEDSGSKAKAKGGDKGKAKGGDEEEDEPKVTDDDDIVIKEDNDRPRAKLTTKATAYAEADPESEESFTATPTTALFPTGKTKGKFTEVENEEGDIGFVLTSKLEIEEVDTGGGDDGVKKGRTISAKARLGVTLVSQTVQTAGGATGIPDNYNLGTSAITLALGGEMLYPYGKKFILGFEGTYDYAKAVPGIKVMGGTTGISLHNLNLRGIAGIDLKKKSGMAILARVGLHYQSFQVSDVEDLAKNTAKLPSEIITAPAIGVALAIPRVSAKIGLKFTLDTMLIGASLKQTKNLEDGASPSVKGLCFGGVFNYRWKSDMDIQATYDLNYESYSFGAPVMTSMRGHTGTSVARSDTFHAVAVGIAKAF